VELCPQSPPEKPPLCICESQTSNLGGYGVCFDGTRDSLGLWVAGQLVWQWQWLPGVGLLGTWSNDCCCREEESLTWQLGDRTPCPPSLL
jgi:hypothetical protein